VQEYAETENKSNVLQHTLVLTDLPALELPSIVACRGKLDKRLSIVSKFM